MSNLKYQRLDSLGHESRPILKAGPFGSSVKKESYVESGFKLYGQQEVLSGNLRAKNYYITSETFDRHKNCSVQAGDILITMMGTVGKVIVIPNEHESGIINPRLMRISLDPTKVNPEFVKIFLETPKLQSLLERRSHGGTMPGLNAEAIASIKVPVPELEFQDYAVKALALWDTATEKTEALIEAKERQFGWLLYELIGSKKSSKNLGEVCSLEKGIRFDKNREDLPYLEIGDVDTKTKTYKISNKDKKAVSGAVKVPQNTLLISTVRPTRGAVTKTHSQIYVSSAFCRLKIENKFYFYCVQQERFFNYLKARQSGATYPTVKNRDILTFKVPVIEKEKQFRIIQILDTAKREIDLLIKLADQYRTQKRGLMQKLLSGEWPVTPDPEHLQTETTKEVSHA